MFKHRLVQESVLRKHQVNRLSLKESELMGEMTYFNVFTQDDTYDFDNLNDFASSYSSITEPLSNDFDVIHNNSICHHAVVIGSIRNVPFITTFHWPLFDNIRMAINSISRY